MKSANVSPRDGFPDSGDYQAVILGLEEGVGSCGRFMRFDLWTRESGFFPNVTFSKGRFSDVPMLFCKQRPELKSLRKGFLDAITAILTTRGTQGRPYDLLIAVPIDAARRSPNPTQLKLVQEDWPC
jgi:hypothetical protein